MTEPRYSIAPPLDAERIISAQLADHAVRLDGDGRATRDCVVCGRLPAGLTLLGHQARLDEPVPDEAGLMAHREPR